MRKHSVHAGGIGGRIAMQWLASALVLFDFGNYSRLCAAAMSNDGTELLSAAANAMSWEAHYISTTNIKYRAIVDQGAHQYMVGSDSVVKKYADAARLHIISDFIDHLTPDGIVVKRAGRREAVFGQNGCTRWWTPVDRPLTGTLQLAKDIERVEKLRRIARSDCATGSFLDGYLDGMGNIIDVIKGSAVLPNAHLNVRDEEFTGIKCRVVEAVTPDSSAAVWIAPSKGNIIVKYVLENRDPADPVRAEFEASELVNVDGESTVRRGRSDRTWVDHSTHAKWHETVDADRTSINLHPRFDEPNLFSTRDAPNGIRVFLDDLPNVGVDFIWSDGKPVAKMDPALFDELGKSVQRTMSGEVARAIPVIQTSLGPNTADDGTHRAIQLWIALASMSAFAVILLVSMSVGRRKSRANAN